MTTDGDVIQTNEAADRLFQSTTLVGIDGGKLRLPLQHRDELFHRCVAIEQELKACDPAIKDGTFQSLQIRSGTGSLAKKETLYMFFTTLTPQGAMGTFGLRPIVMLCFYHPDSAPAIDSNLLFAAFGLTPAECRIASLLAEGLSLKAIAEAQGTQHETVRKQLQSIYQKTSTNRQPELVRLLLHLPHNVIQSS